MTLQERVAKLEKEVNKPVLSEAEMREQLLEQVFFSKKKKSYVRPPVACASYAYAIFFSFSLPRETGEERQREHSHV